MTHRPSGISRRALLISSLVLAGCANLPPPPKPPLRRIYGATTTSLEQPPLVFIPGAFGSTLRDIRTDRELWPASDVRLLFGTYANLELAIDADQLEPIADGIEVDGVFEDGLGQDFYGRVLRTLERIGGYRLRKPGDPVEPGQRNFYVYLYDWRLDNTRVVGGLHELIQQIRVDYGDPQLKVDILAHSNGGLLARYYARYGHARLTENGPIVPVQPGADTIRKLLMVGTPNLGTIQPVLSHLRGEEIGLRKIRPEVMATCPGATQLLPHPCLPWLIDLHGATVRRDVFAIDTWREFRWSIFDPEARRRIVSHHGGGAAGRRYLEVLERYFDKQLRQGRRFIEALAEPGWQSPFSTILFGGDCAPTLARLVVERVDGHFHARERPADIVNRHPGVDYDRLMFDPGDLVVTRDSLEGRYPDVGSAGNAALAGCDVNDTLQADQTVFLCEEHRQLTGNLTFQDNLLHALLRQQAS